MTQEQLAEQAGVSVDVIRKLEQQRRDGVHTATLRKLAEGLKTEPAALMGGDGTPGEKLTTERLVGKDDDEALELVEALGHSNITPGALDVLEASVGRVLQVYSHVPPPSLLGWARHRLGAITALLNGSQPLVQRRRLYVVAGRIAGLRAWLAHDLRRPASAAVFYSVAATAACEAEDDALHAWVLGNRSRIPIYEGMPCAALDLINEAIAHAEGHADAATRAWLLAQASRAHSAMHDHAAGARALAQAERILDHASAESTGSLVYFDGCRLVSFIGHHHLLAGQPGRAEEYLRSSLAKLRPQQVRHIALTRLDLAAALIAQGELAEGCDQAVAALTIPREEQIDSIVRRAGQLRGRLGLHGSRFAPAREVVELIDALQ